MDCPELIEEFEAKLQDPNSPKRKLEQEVITKKKKIASIEVEKEIQPRGFDRGLIADKILGATDSKGELMFLMKWKNSQEADLVPARIANIKCPQVVIRFYEERLMWHNSNDDEAVDLQAVNVVHDDQENDQSESETIQEKNRSNETSEPIQTENQQSDPANTIEMTSSDDHEQTRSTNP